jgi:transposase
VLSLPPSVRIFLCRQAVDFRRGFDGLAQLVRDHLRADPLSGHLYVFHNRRADRLKILVWDNDGFVLWHKRLERGTYRIPAFASDASHIELRSADLILLLDGVILESVRRTRRFQLPQAKSAS